MWKDIVKQADTVTYVSKLLYKPYLMQKRNEYMVNQCNELIAVFDGTQGGTANCVKYAEEKGKKIVTVNPNELIIEHKGDILRSDCDVVMHQANCQSTMGSGIAKQIRAEFPVVYEVDCASPMTSLQKLGGFTKAAVHNNGKSIEIVNLYGQLNYGADRKLYTNYEALKNALFGYLNDRLEREGTLSQLKIGVPKYMGCARAGGDWKVVTGILEAATKEFNISIHTYEFAG
jgi:O-acetyl-ADP-ribose deacetylase (regulator of RNase III)